MIVAFDVASRTGIAWGEPGAAPQLATKDFRSSGSGEPDSFANAIEFTQRFLKTMPADLTVVIEGRAMVAQTYTSLHHGLWACVAGAVRLMKIELIEAPIGSWRAYSLGKGNLNGKLAKARAIETCKRLGWEARNHDSAEAAMIWLYACALRAPRLAPRTEPLFLRGA